MRRLVREAKTILNEAVDLRIEKLVHGGDALARQEGRVVLVPFALPGELVRVRLEKAKGGVTRAKLDAVLEPSPERCAAPCPHYSRCGGCHLQHTAYASQVTQKIAILREVLQRVGKFEPPGEIATVTGPDAGYRNRIQLHFDGKRLGFHEPGTHAVSPIESCMVASPRLNQAITALRAMMRDRRWPDFLRALELFTNEEEVQVNVLDSGPRHLSRSFFDWCAERIPGATAAPTLRYPTPHGVFRVSYKSFFQVNRFLVGKLVDVALEGATGATAWDLYAGVGLFSRALAERFAEVTAVEAVNSAAADLEHNIRGAEARRSTTELFVEAATAAPDFVIADPPRSGLGKQVTAALARLRPRRLVIVSCDPATLARDLAPLLAAGFAIQRMTIVDLFPHTAHLETVVELA